jgi:hypothetical protein
MTSNLAPSRVRESEVRGLFQHLLTSTDFLGLQRACNEERNEPELGTIVTGLDERTDNHLLENPTVTHRLAEPLLDQN